MEGGALFFLAALVAALWLIRVIVDRGASRPPRPPPSASTWSPAPGHGPSPAAPARPQRTTAFSGRARVIDGDTIDVAADDGGTIRVRLHGIDAPEIGQVEGEEARAMLRKILKGGECAVEPKGGDVYGRLVARVRRSDGKDVGLCMIAAGLAIAVKPCPPIYQRVEAQARSEARGAWARSGFERPADWRRANPRPS